MEEDEVCDVCGAEHNTEVCPELGLDPSTQQAIQLSRARLTLPHNLDVTGDITDGTLQVVASFDIPNKTQFGPFEAKRSTNDVPLDGIFVLKVIAKDKSCVVLDCSDENECNWMCLVQAAKTAEDQNCIAYQLGVNIFYNTTRLIRTGEKLQVWYASQYAKKLGKPAEPDGTTKVMLGTDTGRLLSIPKVPDSSSDHSRGVEQLGKRQRKITADVAEFLQNARKRIKVEPPDEIGESTVKAAPRRRGRPPKIRTDPLATSLHQSTRTESDVNGESVGGGDIDIGDEAKDDNIMSGLEDVIEQGEKEGGEFKCTRCPKAFSSQANMVKHLRTHIKLTKPHAEPVRTLFCMECGKGFVNSSNLGRHMKIHKRSLTRTITCKLCSYQTYRHDIMRTHMDARHNVKYTTPRVGRRRKGNYVVYGGKKRGRKPKYIKQEEESSPEKTDAPGTPRRVMPNRRNRGKKMMEALMPLKKSTGPGSDQEEDEEVIEDSGSSAVVSDDAEGSDEDVARVDDLDMCQGEQGHGDVEQGEVTIAEGETLRAVNPLAENSMEVATEDDPPKVTEETSEGTAEESDPVLPKESAEEPNDVAENDQTVTAAEDAVGDTSIKAEPLTPTPRRRGRPRKSENSEPTPKFPRADLYDVFLTQDDRTIYGCKECGKKFQNIKYLTLHLAIHTKKFACEKCGKSFAKQESLERHSCSSEAPAVVVTTEGDRVRYSCTICSKSFANEEYARQHYTIHSGTFQCQVCRQQFHSKLGLTNHKCNKEAAARKLFTCDICSQTFRTSSYLFRHMAMHTDIFKCNTCGKCFSRKDSMQRHVLKCDPVRALEEDLHACVNCHKAYGTQLALENHLLVCYKTYCFKCKQNFATEEECTAHECNPDAAPQFNNAINPDYRVSCKHCSKTFRNLKYLKRHEASHNGEFKCKICSRNFSRKEELIWHIVLCENAEKIKTDGFVTCDLCNDGTMYRDAKAFREHHYTHTHPYQCEKCRKRFRKQGTIHTHHCDPNEYQEGGFPCSQCDKVFSCKTYLERHAVIHGDRQFECEICHKRFFRQDYLKDHRCILPDGTKARIVRRHNRVVIKENVVCDLCGASFVSSSNLNKHMKTHGEKEFECDICHKRFHYLAYLKDHKFHVHGGGLELQCAMCGKILKTKTSLKSHIYQFHSGVEPEHECQICHKRFRQKGNLKTHMYSHSSVKQFRCKQCFKAFKYPDQLARHTLEHTMKNKFTCELCNRQFVKKFELNRHQAVFHNGLAYVCSLCKTKCSHRHTLVRHFKRKHAGSMFLLSNEDFVQSMLTPFKKDSSFNTKQKRNQNDYEISAEEAAANAIASAALASESTNAPTMSIGQTFTNEMGETFTESVITDADGNETTIVYQTPEGFSTENDLPQVAAEALQSLSHSVVSADDIPAALSMTELQEGELNMDDQHTVVIVQIVNQDEETDLGETYTIPQEQLAAGTDIITQEEAHIITQNQLVSGEGQIITQDVAQVVTQSETGLVTQDGTHVIAQSGS